MHQIHFYRGLLRTPPGGAYDASPDPSRRLRRVPYSSTGRLRCLESRFSIVDLWSKLVILHLCSHTAAYTVQIFFSLSPSCWNAFHFTCYPNSQNLVFSHVPDILLSFQDYLQQLYLFSQLIQKFPNSSWGSVIPLAFFLETTFQ